MRSKFPVTVHIFLFREEKVLLLRRFNTGYEDGNYSVPAGHVEQGETITQAAIREVKEEIGVEVQPADLQVVGVIQRKSNDERVDFFLTASKWTGEPANLEKDKSDELIWSHLDKLPVNTIPYIKRAIKNFLDSVWFEEFGW